MPGVVTSRRVEPHIEAITVNAPPVNAMTVESWFTLAKAITAAGDDRDCHVVILRAEGRGFNAGSDIKEMQATPGYDALIGANHGSAAAFSAVYDCKVPVIVAAQGYCLGGGVGLVGNADVIVAAEGTTFGLPEVDRGALGAATHLARLVPQHRMRTLYYTAANVGAEELYRYGTVHRVVPRPDLDEAALEVARAIAAKQTEVIRKAKEAINGIDPQPVHTSYRFEQGFTFELNLAGYSDLARQEFVDGGRTDKSA